MKEKNIYEKLMYIQAKLKAPKGQYNKYGGYNFRSCEDILEGLKPLLQECEVALLISDDIVMIGDRYYIKATVKLVDNEKAEVIATAYARETEHRSGMDNAQVTGATSSYARKYALNGLFCIDDTKDPDALEYSIQQSGQKKTKTAEPDRQTAEPVGQTSPPQKLKPSAAKTHHCTVCGKEIDGSLARGSTKKYGAPYCSGECVAKAQDKQAEQIGQTGQTGQAKQTKQTKQAGQGNGADVSVEGQDNGADSQPQGIIEL